MKEETRKLLLEETELDINLMTKSLDESNRIYTALKEMKNLIKENNIQLDLNNLIRLAEYRTLIGILHLDINVAIRIFLNGKSQYEGLYAARQIIVIINEGFKKIFHFTNTNKGRDRLESFWIKDIKMIIDNDLPYLEETYKELTQKLDSFCENNFSDKVWKNKRNLSVHYDKNPSKFYSMLIGLNIEETILNMIPFLDIINKMFVFTFSIIKAYQLNGFVENQNRILQIDNIINLTNKVFEGKDKNEKVISGLEMILKMKKFLLKVNKTNT